MKMIGYVLLDNDGEILQTSNTGRTGRRAMTPKLYRQRSNARQQATVFKLPYSNVKEVFIREDE